MKRSLHIVVASSGLGHVSRGIEAWAADLGHALAQRGESLHLCKGGGEDRLPYEFGIPCWQRTIGTVSRSFITSFRMWGQWPISTAQR